MNRESVQSIDTPEGYWSVFREKFLKMYGGRGFVILEDERNFGAQSTYYPTIDSLRAVYKKYSQKNPTSIDGVIVKDLEREIEEWKMERRRV
jgi:hypothetical protein